MNKQLNLVFIAIALSAISYAQNVGIGTALPNSDAALDVSSLNKGFLLPRMSASQRIAINPAASAKSLLVFDTDSTAFFYWTGSEWNKLPNTISSGANYWNSNGTHLYTSNAGNVGIGTTNPAMGGLVVDKKAGAVNALFGSNTSGVAIESSFPGIGFNSYYNGIRTNIATGYSGYLGVDPVAGGMQVLVSDASYAGGSPGNYNIALNIKPDGKVGVGVSDAVYLLDVGERMRIRSKPGSSAGLWLNNDANTTSPAFIGMRDNNNVGIYGAGSNWSFRMNTQTGNIGIGDVSPNAPLQFDNSGRNRKIVLYESANNDHQFYGFGINASTLRYQTASAADDHVFFAGAGTGSSNELMRVKGNGYVGIGVNNPVFRLDVKDRMRIRSGGDNNTSAGIYFNNNANGLAAFIGMQSDNQVGLYGNSGAGWGLTMNTQNGALSIGGSAGQAGQVLTSNGSGAPAAWTFPGNIIKTGITENNTSPSIPKDNSLQEFTADQLTISLPTASRVILYYKVRYGETFANPLDDQIRLRLETDINGSTVSTYLFNTLDRAIGLNHADDVDQSFGPDYFDLPAGTHQFSFWMQNRVPPVISNPLYGGNLSLQVAYTIIAQ